MSVLSACETLCAKYITTIEHDFCTNYTQTVFSTDAAALAVISHDDEVEVAINANQKRYNELCK